MRLRLHEPGPWPVSDFSSGSWRNVNRRTEKDQFQPGELEEREERMKGELSEIS